MTHVLNNLLQRGHQQLIIFTYNMDLFPGNRK